MNDVANLQGKKVLVIGRPSGIALAIVVAAREAGANVVAAGRNPTALNAAYSGSGLSDTTRATYERLGVPEAERAYSSGPDVTTEVIDLTDEASIISLAERLGSVDHVISTASARARGRLADLDRDALRLSFDTKVLGPLMLAKHFSPRMNEDGSFVIFSGVAAAKIAVGTMGVAITNGSAEVLVRSLALELAPIRVNGISPGVIDTGAWDAFGEQGKAEYFADIVARNPAGRIGNVEDVVSGVMFALTNTFLTGQTLHIDGGEPLT
jgi:NAD(P)-dependent dehydrogenase (short-subunit alcohol dehydrogenase family)